MKLLLHREGWIATVTYLGKVIELRQSSGWKNVDESAHLPGYKKKIV